MNNSARIAGYTIRDQMRHKSFYVLLGISILFILMFRECSEGRFVVNGRTMDRTTVALYFSNIVFQLIAAGMFLMAAMLSMRIFSRDRADGGMVLFLSRPVFRRQYVLGRIAGTWALCAFFMFILHLTVFLLIWIKTGAVISGYLAASLICSMNLLFIVACVCLLSLYMPDFISVVFTMMILFVGFISDGGYQLVNSELAKSMLPSDAHPGPDLWRILYPKVFMVQTYAGSIINGTEFNRMGPFHPVFNVSFFILLLTALMLIRFNRKEI